MKVLVIDIGGTNLKILATGQEERRRFKSSPNLTSQLMVTGVKKLAADWEYDVISIGCPGRVLRNRLVAEPRNLARRWVRLGELPRDRTILPEDFAGAAPSTLA